MNLMPKPRALWKRTLAVAALCFLFVWKVLHLPTFIFPAAVRSVTRNWTYGMFGVVIRSMATRAYMDQPCTFTPPPPVPKVDVVPEHRMSQTELESFYKNGFIGPFDAFTPEQMSQLREPLRKTRTNDSPTFGFCSPRDWHLEFPTMLEMMRNPVITDRLAQVLGPDLAVWRSQLFYKRPGAEAIQWHQASTFMVDDYLDPLIVPPNRDELFQVTVWVAIDDATAANGCLRFLPGSHKNIWTLNFGKDDGEGFYHARYKIEYPIDEKEVMEVEVKSGQFIIFIERCLHSSGPNTTDRERLAFNYRVVPPNVAIYPNKTRYRSVFNGGKYQLDKWAAVLLRGEDTHGKSRFVDVDTIMAKQPPSLPNAA